MDSNQGSAPLRSTVVTDFYLIDRGAIFHGDSNRRKIAKFRLRKEPAKGRYVTRGGTAKTRGH